MKGGRAELLQELAAKDRRIEVLERDRERLLGEEARLQREGELLRELLRRAKARLFGRSSEKLDHLQGALLLGEEDVRAEEVDLEAAAGSAPEGSAGLAEEEEQERKATKKKREYKKRHPGRAELPAHLERVVKEVRVEEEHRGCPKCGCEMEVIGHECREELDLVPAHYVVQVIQREKLACRNRGCEGGHVRTAPAPPKAIERAKASDALIAHLAVAKYADHRPVYRQVVAMRREGLEMSRETVYGWLAGLCELLRLIYEAMAGEVRAAPSVQADETRVTVLGNGHSAKGSRTGWFWQYSIPGGTLVYDFQMDRSRAGPAAFLAGYQGTLQCDGYGAYEETGAPEMRRAGCMAHARRGFAEAMKAGDARGLPIVEMIGELYGLETFARENGLNAEERLAMRLSRSAEIFERIGEAIVKLRSEALPQSAAGKACAYFLNQYDRLKLFLEDGEVELDNNLCENGMRPLALGRKNWMFVGNPQAGVRAGRIASIIETCRRLEINPEEYLREVLAAIAGGLPANRMAEWTPARWKAARSARNAPEAVA